MVCLFFIGKLYTHPVGFEPTSYGRLIQCSIFIGNLYYTRIQQALNPPIYIRSVFNHLMIMRVVANLFAIKKCVFYCSIMVKCELSSGL
jgi:hypothetical protein